MFVDRNVWNICRSGLLAAIRCLCNSRQDAAPARRLPSSVSRRTRQHGFSLVEIIIGMVITAIALTSLTALLYPQFARGVDPIFQIRAAELGQALAEEILGKAFDENSPVGGNPPCGTCSVVMGPDAGEVRNTFDDVDDYNVYNAIGPVIDANGLTPTGFGSFQMRITVINDDNYSGSSNGNNVAKLITVRIFPPVAGQAQALESIDFVFYRSNF